MAEAYDLADPWHTPVCGLPQPFEGNPLLIGLSCCVNKTLKNGPKCVGDHRGLWSANDTRQWANLGPLHPRVKSQVGARLAQGLHAAAYNGSGMIAAGPVLSGCRHAKDKKTLTIFFNSSLLRGETVLFNKVLLPVLLPMLLLSRASVARADASPAEQHGGHGGHGAVRAHQLNGTASGPGVHERDGR